MLRTANLTREDFSIEELHCQVVFKIQRQKQVLRDIEMMPAEREQEECFFMEDSTEIYPSGKKSSQQRGSSKNVKTTYYP